MARLLRLLRTPRGFRMGGCFRMKTPAAVAALLLALLPELGRLPVATSAAGTAVMVDPRATEAMMCRGSKETAGGIVWKRFP